MAMMPNFYALEKQNEAADLDCEAALARRAAACEVLRAANWFVRYCRSLNRPSVLLRPQLSEVADCVTGNVSHYIASYGGLFAAGTTPDEAFEEFDRLWIGGN